MHQYVNDTFVKSYKPTIGADFLTKEMIIDEVFVTMQIWDTAGQERFKSLGGTFYRGADACILMYDITDQNSFTALDSWMNEFLSQTNPENAKDFPFLLLGNKSDKPKQERKVSEEQAIHWCKGKNDMPFFESSAKNNVNVEQAFQTVIRHALKKEQATSGTTSFAPKDALDLNKREETQAKTGCCGG